MSNSACDVSVISSNNGGFQLIHDGYVFRSNKRTKTKVYWRCTVTNCTAHIHTDPDNNLLNTTGQHNHLLEPEELEVKRFRRILKERVMNETVPIQKIYDEEIAKGKFSPEVLASIPLAHSLRMNMIPKFSSIYACNLF